MGKSIWGKWANNYDVAQLQVETSPWNFKWGKSIQRFQRYAFHIARASGLVLNRVHVITWNDNDPDEFTLTDHWILFYNQCFEILLDGI